MAITKSVLYPPLFAAPDGRELGLDLHLPSTSPDRVRPIVLVHDEREESKEALACLASALATNGFAAATVEYRGPYERLYPAALEDVLAAVRWLRAQAGELGIETDRIGAVGLSAGSHLAALLGVTPHRKTFGELVGSAEPSAAIQAAVLISGVVDMAALYPRDRASPTAFLGVPLAQNPELWAEASPINHVGRDAAAFLFLHGTRDHLGSHAEVAEMAAQLRSHGLRAEVFSAADGQHDFWSHDQWREPGMTALIKFLKQTLGSGR